MLLPVRRQIETVAEDDTKTALVVNRAIYRAHREMRLGVMEASKRFEEKQKRHQLNKKLEKEGKQDGLGPGIALVMRRKPGSVRAGSVGSDQLKPVFKELATAQEEAENEKSEQDAVDKASTKSGRPRRNRKKTCSDMTGMLAKIQDEDA
jgi:hypothetical protein